MYKIVGLLVGLTLLSSCGSKKEMSAERADVASIESSTEAPDLAATVDGLSGEAPPPPPPPPPSAPSPPPVAFTPPVVKADEEVQPGSSQASARPVPAARQLIYRAEVDIKVRDLARAGARVDSLVRRSGSWVAAATQTRADEEWRQEMTIRVRPAQFNKLLSGLGALGTVERNSLSTDDMTAEHAGITARLRTKRALEQRYLGLLGQARKVSDILEIEEKLGGIREEIEATESRLKALNDQVAYSTITLKLYQPLNRPAPDAPVLSFGSRVVEAFYGGWELVTGLVIGVLYLWPLLILLGAGLWLVRRWRRRRVSARN